MSRAITITAVCCVALALASATGCGSSSVAGPLADRVTTDSPAAGQTELPSATDPGEPAAAESGAEAASKSVRQSSPDPAPEGTPSANSLTAPAEPATAPPAQRPPADRTVTKPGDAEKITWEDVNLGMQADVVFRPFMINDRVKDLEGKRISIVGYMHGGQAGQRGIKEFILLKNTQCKFGPGGQADHLADIKLKPDSATPYTPSPIKVEGTLVIEPFEGPDGNTWSLYRLEGAQVRPQ